MESIDLVVKFHAVNSELEKNEKQYFLFYSTFSAKKTCFWVKNLVAVLGEKSDRIWRVRLHRVGFVLEDNFVLEDKISHVQLTRVQFMELINSRPDYLSYYS